MADDTPTAGEIVTAIAAQFPYRDIEEALALAEMGLEHGAGRADLAILDSLWWGIEVKSERDTLRRLRRQLQPYNHIFDRCLLVAAPRHIAPASVLLPSHWGLYEARKDGDNIVIIEHRPASRNAGVIPLSVAKLLWKQELCSLLPTMSPRRYHAEFARAAGNTLPLRCLRRAVVSYMRDRKGGDWVRGLRPQSFRERWEASGA